MIQELFGGASSAFIGAEASFNNGGTGGGIILHGTPAASPSPSPAASPSSSTTTAALTTATATNTTAPETQQNNLRCPRCDSSNTKFCYYNNYNLTQPRHFCKTCRRYWTKGGALRNVPIGGGCRKNKTSTHISSSVAKSTVAAKFKALPADMGIRAASHLVGGGGFDPNELPSGWVPPQSSQILALLRGNPINPNPNPNPNMKEEGNIFGTNMASHGVGLGLDPVIGQLPSIGLCGSFWRNNGNLNHHQMGIHQNQMNHFHQPNEMQNQSAMHALYQRIKLSTGESNTADHNSTTMATSSSSSMMEQPLMATTTTTTSADQMVYWQNSAPAFCWSDLPTTTSNGAYP